jgi:hypothetical protein
VRDFIWARRMISHLLLLAALTIYGWLLKGSMREVRARGLLWTRSRAAFRLSVRLNSNHHRNRDQACILGVNRSVDSDAFSP